MDTRRSVKEVMTDVQIKWWVIDVQISTINILLSIRQICVIDLVTRKIIFHFQKNKTKKKQKKTALSSIQTNTKRYEAKSKIKTYFVRVSTEVGVLCWNTIMKTICSSQDERFFPTNGYCCIITVILSCFSPDYGTTARVYIFFDKARKLY